MAQTGYRLDGASIAALRKLVRGQGRDPIAPPISQIRKRIPGPGGGVMVQVNAATSTLGIYTGTLMTGSANGSSGTSIMGISSGPACIVYNGVEIASPVANPYIATTHPPVLPGVVIGTDPATGYPIILVSAVSLGCS